MSSNLRLIAVALWTAGALSLIWGCGGNDSTSASLTKAQFAKKANQICEDAEKEQLELATKYLRKHPGAEEEEMIVPIGVPPLEKQTERLKALPAPDGGEAQVEAIIASLEKAVDDTKANPGKALSTASNPFDESNELSEKYGLTQCAGSP